MIRISEAVLPGHPDKLCDQIADAILDEARRVDPDAYGQVEVAGWNDEFFVTGGLIARGPIDIDLTGLVRRVGREVGYTGDNALDADRFVVHDRVCREVGSPAPWNDHPNDQCVVIGWAGYDALTGWLPPEHFLAHRLRSALADACRPGGRLAGCGPDGKLLVRLREDAAGWVLEHVLVTIQHRETDRLMEVADGVRSVVASAYGDVRRRDRRWAAPWKEVNLLVNPNGQLVHGGTCGDNGQTGRKLAMDYYGPRVPLGGGALSGKAMGHIDRAAAYRARQAAVTAVAGGARECLVRVAYAPNVDAPLDVAVEMAGVGPRPPAGFFDQSAMWAAPHRGVELRPLSVGTHFAADAPWNRPADGGPE